MKKIVIGIDISKKSTDWCVLDGRQAVEQIKVDNTVDELAKALRRVARKHGMEYDEMMVCAEYTGKYIYPLTVACHDEGVFLWMENAYNISCEAKRERGKSDSVDARRIAEYARKNQDEARVYVLPDDKMAGLKSRLARRHDYSVERSKYMAKISDSKGFMPEAEYKETVKEWRATVRHFDKLIGKLEKEINDIIQSDEQLKRQDELLRSIPGIGETISRQVIASTSAFSAFPDGRKYCCHVGSAPFAYTSGTSIHSCRRVSSRADKEMKRYLHMAALTAATIWKSGLFVDYYQRKVAEGKNRMSVLNAVRAKLILTMFAVIRDNRPFDPNFNYFEEKSKKLKINLAES